CAAELQGTICAISWLPSERAHGRRQSEPTRQMNSVDTPKLRLESIRKSFYKAVGDRVTEVPVLAGIDLAVERGRFVSIIGPSGRGKSTLLRIVDGLIRPDSGRLLVDGAEVTEPGFDRAVVFQYFGLYPWRNVLDNVAFGLELQGVPKAERRQRSLAN